MQSWLLRRTSLCLSPLVQQQGARTALVATSATTRRLYSTDVEPSTTTIAAAAPSTTSHPHPSTSSHNGSSNGSNPLQQLYKSTHKGKGDKAMPKVMPRQQLKKRTIFTENEKTMEAEMKQQEEAVAAAPAAKRSKSLPKSRKITDMKEAEQLFGARSSCAEDAGPVGERALSPLQKRQLLFRNKAAFVLTPQALRRVKFLISQYHLHTQGKNGNNKKTKRNGSANGATAAEEEKTNEAAAPVAIPSGIRIGVRRRGCSGYSYTVNYYFDKEQEQAAAAPAAATTTKGAAPKSALAAFMKGDVTVEQENVKVVVEQDALFYVIGTEMDYVVRNVEEKFTFKNPNQKFSCGCEESFMPFDEDDLDD